jgi:RNA 2',3'-cyclic 3'-phosphodiesterase
MAPVDPPGVLRLFFALPVPNEARARIAEVVERVQRDVGDGTARIRWVNIGALHLTLRFLGPTPGEKVEQLGAHADDVARATRPFDVTLRGGGAFPNGDRPRSLWIGVTDGAEALARLADALTAAAVDCGLVIETRPFAAHLTVARTDGLRLGAEVARILRRTADELEIRFTADRLVLFRSQLGGGPARYEPLHESQFAG